jgi:hypothetical protein
LRRTLFATSLLFLGISSVACRPQRGSTPQRAPELPTDTQKHAGKTVESRDLRAAIEAASGKDLTLLFREWVEE